MVVLQEAAPEISLRWMFLRDIAGVACAYMVGFPEGHVSMTSTNHLTYRCASPSDCNEEEKKIQFPFEDMAPYFIHVRSS